MRAIFTDKNFLYLCSVEWQVKFVVGIEFLNSNIQIFGPNKTEKASNSKQIVSFTQNPDTFEISTPAIYNFGSEQVIKKLIDSSPRLKRMLKFYGIDEKINIEELQKLIDGHLIETQNTVGDIYKNLPPAAKSKINLKAVKDAALYHDFGKVLIPVEILNKPASLSPSEHEIMDLHTEIGYELLKNSGLNDKALFLIKNHHNKNLIPSDLDIQILNLADRYCALTENRPYKVDYTPKQAMTILYNDVENGNIDPFIYYALQKAINKK